MTDYLNKAREIMDDNCCGQKSVSVLKNKELNEIDSFMIYSFRENQLADAIAKALKEEREQTFKDIEMVLHEIQNLVFKETGMASIGLKTTIEAIEKLRTLKDKVK